MTKATFNATSAGGYTNHAQVFRDITNIAAQLQEVWQPELENITTDVRVQQAYVQMSKDTDALIGRIIDGIVGKIKASGMLAANHDIYTGFHKLLEETRMQFSSRMVIARLSLDGAKGEDVASALEYWQSYHQNAKAEGARQLKNLITAIYDFKDGQTMDDVLADNMTMKDFERCNAILNHTIKIDGLLVDMPKNEEEMVAHFAKAQKYVSDIIATLDKVEAAAKASSNMNAAEKQACIGVVSASVAILRNTLNMLDAMLADDVPTYEKAAQESDALAMTALQRNADFYAVLDQHYEATAKAKPAKAAAKASPTAR